MAFIEKTIRSKRIYEGKILNLRIDEVVCVKGNPSIREIVEHRGGVVMAAVTSDLDMVMIRQFRKAVEEIVFEAPAGKLEAGEEIRKAALRELEEETGYKAKTMEYMGSYYASCGYTEEKLHLFLCTDLIKGEATPDENEDIDLELVPLERLYEMTVKGEIKDAKTALIIMLAADKMGIKKNG